VIPELAPLEGKYQILRKLREGGMGAIFLVRHRLLGELRVVKVLRAQLQGEEEFRDRFAREARVAIQLRHANVAQLYDFAVDDRGSGFMVLEYVAGRTVQELVAARRIESIPLAIEIACQALDAIGFLHRRGFVHRDISPDNLMLSRTADGEPLVKLIDLGIVKILRGEEGKTGTAVFLGKVRYASPEQFESSRIDGRSDLYSFGVLLYELLTGIHPFPGEGMHSMVSGHMLRPPRPFEETDPEGRIPGPLREVVLAALAKNPDERPQTAEEFAERLRAIELEPVDLRALVSAFDFGGEVEEQPPGTGSDRDAAQQALDDRFRRDRQTPEPESVAETEKLGEPRRAEPSKRSAAGDLLVERKLEEWRALLDEPGAPRGVLARYGRRLGLAAAVVALLVMTGWATRSWWRAPEPLPGELAVAARPDGETVSPEAGGMVPEPAPSEPPAVERSRAAEPAVQAPGRSGPVESEPPVQPVARGWLRVDAAPWGEVVAIQRAAGGEVAVPLPTATPFYLEVDAGSYRVSIRDPRSRRLRETVVAVPAGGTGVAFVALAPVDVRGYFLAQGLEP